jgi:cellulose biosynthesis protein BcsQ
MGIKHDVDIFVIDTGPSLGALNRAILLGTDYFITPVMADAFSVQ